MIKIEKAAPDVSQGTPFSHYVNKSEKRLKHWGAELDKLAQTGLSMVGSQKEAFDKRIVELQTKRDFAQSKLEALRGAGEHKWEAFKEELELSARALETSIKSRPQLRSTPQNDGADKSL